MQPPCSSLRGVTANDPTPRVLKGGQRIGDRGGWARYSQRPDSEGTERHQTMRNWEWWQAVTANDPTPRVLKVEVRIDSKTGGIVTANDPTPRVLKEQGGMNDGEDSGRLQPTTRLRGY